MEAEVYLAGLREQFDTEGFVVFPDFLSESEIGSLRKEVNVHYGSLREASVSSKGAAFEKFATEVIPWDPVGERNAAFVDLLGNASLDRVTEACIGAGYAGTQSLVMLSPPGGKGQAWHQDCPIGQIGHFNVNRLIYIDDVTLDNGAIVLVPGSHRMGVIPKGGPQESFDGEVILTPRAGTLVLLNGLIYHRVTPNHSASPRTSVNFRAFAAGIPTDVCNIGVYRNGAFDFRTNTQVKG